MNRPLRLVLMSLLASLVAVGLLFAAGCGDDDGDSAASGSSSTEAGVDGTAVTIADKGFPESQVVAQLYAQALEGKGYAPTVKSLGSTEIADAAVRKGDIDVYPEYTGTAYNVVLGKEDTVPSEEQFSTIQTEYARRGLTVLEPSPYSNDNRVACTREAVDQYKLRSLTDLGKASKDIVYSANPEHLTRVDGLPLLKKQYGVNFKDVKSVALNLRYKPVEDGQAQCVYAFGTDPQIASQDLVLLEDDKGAFQGRAYENFPVINTAFADAQPPAFKETIDAVDAALTQEAVTGLNAQVSLDKDDPEEVAQQFLEENDLT